MPKVQEDEIYIGMVFANNWKVVKRYSQKEYAEILKKATGIEKKLHNPYYLCRNLDCGVETYIERTQIRRALGRQATSMHQCKKCNPNNCYYKQAIRTHTNPDNISRAPKVQPGDTNGIFTVIRIIPTTESHKPQIQLECKCNKCGAIKTLFMHHYESLNHACECAMGGSMGEKLVEDYLKKKKVLFTRECTFKDLIGDGNGLLRYDFGILNFEKKIIALIEFDGEQHFSTGNLFNPTGQVQIHDERKNEYAKNHKLPLLRIPHYEANKIPELIDNFMKGLKK